MINNYKKLLLAPLFGLILSSNALAVTFVNNSNILTGINGLINVTERDFCGEPGGPCSSDFLPNGVEYSLDILDPNSTIAINSFAISINTEAFPGDVGTFRNGWDGGQMSPAQWDAIYGSGSFNAFFGSDQYVNLFSLGQNSNGGPITVGSDNNFEFWQSFGFFASNFVAFNANGGVVDQSRTSNSVPEPAPLALLGLGLMGIGLLRKRRKS